MVGTTDLLMGTRGEFDDCKYWVVNTDDLDLEEYTHNTIPSGTFKAQETTAKERRKLVINNSFMFDEDLVTIKTKSQISLKQGDLVEYEEEIWQVKSSQSVKITKNEQFMKRPCRVTYIQLRK